MNTVLRIPELCDHIADYLCESSADLKSCAFISRALTSSAQRHLFRDIVLYGNGLPMNAVHLPQFVDEEVPCERLCAVLKTSPHLVPFVRRLRASLEAAVVVPLSKIKFPNLQGLVLHRAIGRAADEGSLVGMAALIRLPSIRSVSLLFPIFHHMGDFRQIFEYHAPRLEALFIHALHVGSYAAEQPLSTPPRAHIKRLHLSPCYEYPSGKWFVDPLFPFDFSALESLECDADFLDTGDALVGESWPTVTQLKLHSRQANYAHLSLARFPALTHFEISSSCISLSEVEQLLATLPSDNYIEYLMFELQYWDSNAWGHQAQVDQMYHLGAALAAKSLLSLRRIQIQILVDSGSEIPKHAWDAFAEFDRRGLLDVL
ncbi:hypothetical protein FB451DRAFT_1563927 [Mycena latifolia]|nr:hypothetical protein FB451DRAFT_1563927 [Mycena latifolia]